MKLKQLRTRNFQSFGPIPTVVDLEPITFLLGPNGSGKTAVLQALARMFAIDPNLRRIRRSDFHVGFGVLEEASSQLWIEADFEFPELKGQKGNHSTIPSNFAHMRLEEKDGLPRVRIRLDAEVDSDGDIQETTSYVLEIDETEEPIKKADVPKHDRSSIQVHYLPAQRDPADHISFSTNALIGRVLRAATWTGQDEVVADLTQQISAALAGNDAVVGLNEIIAEVWTSLHKGTYFSKARVSFERNEIESLLRHLTIGFTPGHGPSTVDYSRMGDGQKSLLYLSLVLAVQNLGRHVISGKLKSWDVTKLRPAIFSMVAMEEPENSLSPHYLGRVIKALTDFAGHHDAQSVVATHSPSLLTRVDPAHIRYLRLNDERQTVIKRIVMPPTATEAYKFVREAVQAFPDLYFSRLAILGEGDSEQIVLPRLFQARGQLVDAASVVVVPLGGRHVNHFWRLLHGLEIPYVTLLDLDLARYGGGWGRVRYAATQLRKFPRGAAPAFTAEEIAALPKWNDDDPVLTSVKGKAWIARLEAEGVFFSSPLDLDFTMLVSYAAGYGLTKADLALPDAKMLSAVLGPEHHGEDQYGERQKVFGAYHTRFKLASKPATHLAALATLDDASLNSKAPSAMQRLFQFVEHTLAPIPE